MYGFLRAVDLKFKQTPTFSNEMLGRQDAGAAHRTLPLPFFHLLSAWEPASSGTLARYQVPFPARKVLHCWSQPECSFAMH